MPRTRRRVERAIEAWTVARLREITGLTQSDLARALGVTRSAVAQWESGERTIPGPVLKLLDIYRAQLGLTEPEPAPPVEERASPPRQWLPESVSKAKSFLLWAVVHGTQTSTSPVLSTLRELALGQFSRALGSRKGLSMKWLEMLAYMDCVFAVDEHGVREAVRKAATPMPARDLLDTFLSDFEDTASSLFREWSHQPHAVASIGQVHRAKTRQDEDVAVKVQHPRMVATLEADLRDIGSFEVALTLLWPKQERNIIYVEMRDRVLEECDYLLEAERMRVFRERFAHRSDLHVPRPIDELCSRRVLTSTWQDGFPLRAFAKSASSEERNRAGAALYSFYYESLIAYGEFHADTNQANYLFASPGDAIILDFGRVKTLSASGARAARGMVRSLMEGDRAGFRAHIVAFGAVPEPAAFDFEYAYRVMRAMFRPVLQDEPFEFTREYVREIWGGLANNVNRAQTNWPRDMIFFDQLYFGLPFLLSELGASVRCRPIMLDLLYEKNAARPAAATRAELESERLEPK